MGAPEMQTLFSCSCSFRESSAPSSAIVGRWMHRSCPGAAKEELSTPLPSPSIRFLTSLTKVHGCKPLAHLRLHPLDHLSSLSLALRNARSDSIIIIIIITIIITITITIRIIEIIIIMLVIIRRPP